jgi:outer membrane protein
MSAPIHGIKKSVKQSKYLLVLLLLVTAARAGDRDAPLVLTLDEAVSLALQQNRDILIADQDRASARAQIREAWSGALPQITISGQYLRNIRRQVMFIGPNTAFNPTSATITFPIGSDNSYALGAQLSQPLFSRKVGVALNIAHTFMEYTQQAFQATEQDVTLKVKKAFYAVLLAQKLVEANRQGLDVVKANLENVGALYRHGTAAEFDLLRAEVQMANTEPLFISAENNLVLAKNNLKNLLALSLEKDIEIQGDFSYDEIPPDTLNEFGQQALTVNPLIQQLKLQESILEKNISIEQANYFPTLNLVGFYQWLTQDNSFQVNNYFWAKTLYVGMQLTYPLFDGFRTTARVQQAAVNREKVEYARLKAEEGLRIQIQATELKMIEAKKRIQGQEKNIEQAQKAVRIAQTRYQNGVGTQLELLDTQVAMTRAQTNYAQAIYDYLIAKAEWEYAVGQSN